MSAAVLRLHGADPSADSVARVDADELEAKLGPTASHVWAILRGVRDHFGKVHITVRGVARAKGYVRTHPRAVEKALRRLRSSGLVRDLGWQVARVPQRRSFCERKVYMREVFGEKVRAESKRLRTHQDYAEHELRYEYIVPGATARWMTSACTWGGERLGAGRRPTVQKPDGKNQEVGRSQESRGGTDSRTKGVEGKKSDRGSSYGGTAAPRPALVEVDGLGTVLGTGTVVTPFALQHALAGVPRYPDITVVPPATVPSPPLLDAGASDDQLVAQLVKTYCAAVHRRLGKRPYVKAGRYYRALAGSARLFIEHEIPPAAWVLFMCDVHRDYTKNARGERPSLPWVYSPKRVARWRGWFGREAPTYGGGRLVFGPRHRALLRQYELMRIELHKSGGDAGEIVMRYFPPDQSYEQQVEAAKQEAASLQDRYVLRVQRGEMLWG